jgi:PAS domain S-box-containing protein
MTAAPKAELRDTGISVLGAMPWSSHVSLFYESTADLLDVIVPFFKAGLEGGELCVWIPPDPKGQKDGERALCRAVPDFDRHLARRDIRFVSAEEFYRPQGTLDIEVLVNLWFDLAERARKEGYTGLRAIEDETWLQAYDWRAVCDFEETFHDRVRARRILIMCAYPIAQRGAGELLDSARAHHVVLARRRGSWDVLETPTLKGTKAEIQRANEELERRVEERTRQLARSEEYLTAGERLSHTGSFGVDVTTNRFNYASAETLRIMGFEPGSVPRRAEFMDRIHPDDRPGVEAAIQAAIAERLDTESEFRVVLPDGRTRFLHSTRHPVLDDAGHVVELLGTAVDITERKRAAEKLARARRSAREKALEARFAAALEERTRLAREIHDSLLQGVTGIALQLRATLPRLRAAEAAEAIRKVVELAESTIRDARRAVWDMRAPSLVQKGLPDALEEAVRRVADGVKVVFEVGGKPRPLAAEAEDTIFRVGQEATLNAVKHASAKKISVKLAYKTRDVTLTVSDDGRGFRVEQAFRAYAGRWGLLGMRERAERIGATLDVRSAAGRGTKVELRVPVSRAARAR